MKHVKNRQKRLICRVVLLFSLCALLLVSGTGCGESSNRYTFPKEDGLSIGFNKIGGIDPPAPAPNYCAVRSEQTEFSVDNVVLTLCFGSQFYGETFDFPVYLNFADAEDNKIPIRTITDYTAEKYGVTKKTLHKTETTVWYRLIFTHEEEIHVPETLFSNGYGKFSITTSKKETASSITTEMSLARVTVYYHVSERTVFLAGSQSAVETLVRNAEQKT